MSCPRHQIVDKSITHLSKEENSQFVDANRLDPALKKQLLYFDGVNFWLVKGRSRSRSTNRTKTKSRTRKASRGNKLKPPSHQSGTY
jgi:hypothetical protein